MPHKTLSMMQRVMKYMLTRLLALGIMLAVGIYLAVIVANFGGFVDDMMRANIDEAIMFTAPPSDLNPGEIEIYFDDLRTSMEEAAGLEQPFLLRSARWLVTLIGCCNRSLCCFPPGWHLPFLA